LWIFFGTSNHHSALNFVHMKNHYKKGTWSLFMLVVCLMPSLTEANSITRKLIPEGQCAGDLTLSTQAEVDAFPATHSCSEIIGTLTISGSDITNLDSLYLLARVGKLAILSNANLSNIDGLSGLTYAGGVPGGDPFSVTISGNTVLSSLHGLSSLQNIGKGLLIGGNGITSLNGLNNLTSTGGVIQIDGNPSLVNLDGLNSLTSTGTFSGASMVIARNPSLVSLTGLNSLKSLPGRLIINSNNSLSSLNGLDSLTRIDGSLYLVSNPSLSNIDALSALTAIGGSGESLLLISNNSLLTNLNGLSSLKSISGTSNTTQLIIDNNSSLVDLTGLSSLEKLQGSLRVSSNPMLQNLDGLGGLTTISGSLQITDNNSLLGLQALSLTSIGVLNQESLIIRGNPGLKNLEGLESLSTIPGGTEIASNASLKDLSGLESVTTIGGTLFTCCPQQLQGTLRITGNPLLKNVDAFSNVTSVYHGIFIRDNASLKNLDGFSSLTEIKVAGLPGTNPPARLEITNNESLIQINGLSSLTIMGGSAASVTVTNNPSLIHCCGLYPLLHNGLGCSPQPSCGTITISGNGAGCTKEDILAGGSCSLGTVRIVTTATASRSATDEISSESDKDQDQLIVLYPNPGKGTFNLEMKDDLFGDYKLVVYDLSKGVIKEQTVLKEVKILKTEIDLGHVPKGMYVLAIHRSNGESLERKFFVVD
jgi:hypothetical protein